MFPRLDPYGLTEIGDSHLFPGIYFHFYSPISTRPRKALFAFGDKRVIIRVDANHYIDMISAMHSAIAMILAAAISAPQDCHYAVGYGMQAHKYIDGSWVDIQQGSFVPPGVSVRFRGWVSVGTNGCDACCANISFLLTTGHGVCGPAATHVWQHIGFDGTDFRWQNVGVDQPRLRS